jgi:hypothetical protein
LVNAIAKHDLSHFYVYGLIIIAMIICDIMSKGNPARMLLFSYCNCCFTIGMFTEGMVSVYAFTSVGLFCSTLALYFALPSMVWKTHQSGFRIIDHDDYGRRNCKPYSGICCILRIFTSAIL